MALKELREQHILSYVLLMSLRKKFYLAAHNS